MSSCGPRPTPDDFRNKNGRIRYSAYRKALKQHNRCVRTEARLNPEVVESRQQTLREALDELGDLAQCVRIGKTFEFRCPDGSITTGTPAQVQAYEQKQQLQPSLPSWALPLGGLAALAFLVRR